MTEPPECPRGHGPMIHIVITDGDDRVLGCMWGCARDERATPDFCDEALDCECTPLETLGPRQISFIEDV